MKTSDKQKGLNTAAMNYDKKIQIDSFNLDVSGVLFLKKELEEKKREDPAFFLEWNGR